MRKKTIAKEIFYEGIGLHKGKNIKLHLIPSNEGGIIFKRVDLEKGKNEIKLDLKNTFDLTRGTNLKNQFGAEVYTIEHFLSALYVLGITDLIVELCENELPICDGSARIFVEEIEKAGIKTLEEEVEELVIKEPIFLTKGDKHIIALPYDGYKVTYTIKFDHTFLKCQMLELDITLENYKNDISNARTFGFDYEIEYLKKNNLALGGTLENAIVIKKDGVLNPNGLRYKDEFVRHKILDLIGDFKVLNKAIKGHIIAVKSGHALDIEFANLIKNI